jgi:predicted TIM-barrel fold metal-dependent hydrolase
MLKEHGLSFDLQTPWWHLKEARALADDFGDTAVILNHTGLPADRSREGLAGWRAALKTIAGADNVSIKISGIGIAGRPWTVADNRSVVLDAIEIFGPKRVMFASNFPVDSLVASFETIFSGFEEITSEFSAEDRAAMFRDNAKRTYRFEGKAK